MLVEFGLTNHPEIMVGTVFSLGGIEYIIGEEAASVLAKKSGHAELKEVGGIKRRTLSYQELVRALVESKDFDQLEP